MAVRFAWKAAGVSSSLMFSCFQTVRRTRVQAFTFPVHMRHFPMWICSVFALAQPAQNTPSRSRKAYSFAVLGSHQDVVAGSSVLSIGRWTLCQVHTSNAQQRGGMCRTAYDAIAQPVPTWPWPPRMKIELWLRMEFRRLMMLSAAPLQAFVRIVARF